MNAMGKYRITYLFALLIMAGLFIETNGKEALFVLILLIVLPIFTGAMAWLGGKDIQLLLQSPVSCSMKQEMDISFQIINKKRFFIGKIELPVTFENALFGQKEEKHLMICPGSRFVEEYFLPVDTHRCGKIKIRQTEICYYDVLGLFRFRKNCSQERVMFVYPEKIPLHILLSQHPGSMETGDVFDEKIRGQDTSETFDLRDYQRGDSLRAVHWKLSCKMDELLIREFSRPANYNTIILFEFLSKSDQKERTDSIINMTASLVSAVMNGLLKLNMGHQVGYMVREEYMESTVDSQDTLIQAINSMMSIQKESDGPDLIQTFMKLGLYHQYTKVIYITGGFDDKAVADLSNLVNLSVIVPWEGEKDYFDSSAGYDILSLAAKEMKENEVYLYI